MLEGEGAPICDLGRLRHVAASVAPGVSPYLHQPLALQTHSTCSASVACPERSAGEGRDGRYREGSVHAGRGGQLCRGGWGIPDLSMYPYPSASMPPKSSSC